MSPFREPPAIELGPLDVGLGRAARRALVGLIPSGGRLLAPEDVTRALRGDEGTLRGAPYAVGVLGSLGLVLVGACAFVAATGGWALNGAAGTAVTVTLVISGGLSLAAVLRAADVPRERLTLRGAVIGRAARRALRNALRLARLAARAPDRFGPRHIAALRKTLATLADPLIVAWIPADVRGRVELLLARAIASSGGARWACDARICAEIRGLLLAAADHLAEPAPAEQDLRALADHAITAAAAQRAPRPAPGECIAARVRRGAPVRSATGRAGDAEDLLAGQDAEDLLAGQNAEDLLAEQDAEDLFAGELDAPGASGPRADRATVRR